MLGFQIFVTLLDESHNGVPIALTEFSLLPHNSLRPYFPGFLSALATITISIITALTKNNINIKITKMKIITETQI